MHTSMLPLGVLFVITPDKDMFLSSTLQKVHDKLITFPQGDS